MVDEIAEKRLAQAVRRLKLLGMKDEGIVAIGEMYSAMLNIGFSKLLETLVDAYSPPTLLAETKKPEMPATSATASATVSATVSTPAPAPATGTIPTPAPEPIATISTSSPITMSEPEDKQISLEDIPVAQGYKMCRGCKRVKPLDEYYEIKTSRGKSLKSRCKTCLREEANDRRIKLRKRDDSSPNILEKLVTAGLPVGKPKSVADAWTLHRIATESGFHAKQAKIAMNQLVRDGVAEKMWSPAKAGHVYYLNYNPPLTLVDETVNRGEPKKEYGTEAVASRLFR